MTDYIENCGYAKIIKDFGIIFENLCYKMNAETGEITCDMNLASEWENDGYKVFEIDYNDDAKWVMVSKMSKIKTMIAEEEE